MIWHIFKKDARLAWRAAAQMVALQICADVVGHLIDLGKGSSQLQLTYVMLLAATLGVLVMAVVIVVHQDCIPGTRQDWLTRPIPRRDLVLAKLLFVVLMLQLPVCLVDIANALVNGFDLSAAVTGAAARNLQLFCHLALPAMLIAVVTRGIGEAVIFMCLILTAFVCVFLVGLSQLLGVKADIMETGSGWLFVAAFDVAAVLGAALVVTLQYSRRRTALARTLVVAGGAAVVCVAFVPFGLAFAMQQALSAKPAAAHAIAVTFNPQAGRFRLPVGAAPVLTSALQVPLQFTGLPVDSIVLMDRSFVRITAADGTLLYEGKTNISVDGLGSILWARFTVHAGGSDGPVQSLYQRIYLPAGVYSRLADRQVRLAVDLDLTLFARAGRYSMPAVGAKETLPDLGRCTTEIDAEGDDVVLSCLSVAQPSSCASAYLEQPETGTRNPPAAICIPTYAPVMLGQIWPDSIYRTRGEVPFFDRSGMFHYPVDGSKLASAKLMVSTFEPQDHFVRHVDTPLVRLSDLTGQAADSVAAK